ncbi:MAG: GNAT family N-acetyltransferase [Clostridia bacterium]|nr:GNAT family N-acetyltransferase [Clostridia bacterium]
MSLTFRFAQPQDCDKILYFIRQLAEYEKMSHEVVADAETLRQELFEKKGAEVIFPCLDGKEVGFALFFHNFSTFLGRRGLYLEDLFILPEYRGRGFGKATLKYLAAIALKRGCGRLEWCCLDWNQPSIDFYLKMGAEPMNDWTTYRLAGDSLEQVGAMKNEQ